MIPYPYNMVDMGGIDLAEANGTVVGGLYAKIVEAVNACGDVVLYNWKFASIEITPQHTSILLGDPITINGAVQVTEQDLVTVPGINPEPPPLTVLVPLEVTENGEYAPSDYNADGFSDVSVSVQAAESYSSTHIWTQSVGGYDASVNVQEGIFSGLTFIPTSDVTNVLYTSVQGTERRFGQIGISYSGKWVVRALEKLHYGLPDNVVNEGGTINWQYTTSVDYIFYFKEE